MYWCLPENSTITLKHAGWLMFMDNFTFYCTHILVYMNSLNVLTDTITGVCCRNRPHAHFVFYQSFNLSQWISNVGIHTIPRYMLSFGLLSGVWSLNADVSEHSLHRQVDLPAYEDGRDSVPKRQHLNSRRRVITQKKAYKF